MRGKKKLLKTFFKILEFFKDAAYVERFYLGFQTNSQMRRTNNKGKWLRR